MDRSKIKFWRRRFLRKNGLRDGKNQLFDEIKLRDGTLSHISAFMRRLIGHFEAIMAEPCREAENAIAAIDGEIHKIEAAKETTHKQTQVTINNARAALKTEQNPLQLEALEAILMSADAEEQARQDKFDQAIADRRAARGGVKKQFEALWFAELGYTMHEITYYWEYARRKYNRLRAIPPSAQELLAICEVEMPDFSNKSEEVTQAWALMQLSEPSTSNMRRASMG